MAKRTIMGVKLDLKPNMFDDMEYLEQLAGIRDGDVLLFPKLILRIAGGDPAKKAEIYDALRDETGRVPATKASEFFMMAMEAVAPKSPSSQS
nr:MAG TPA: hypothetical protein [Bacteriophage sp.]